MTSNLRNVIERILGNARECKHTANNVHVHRQLIGELRAALALQVETFGDVNAFANKLAGRIEEMRGALYTYGTYGEPIGNPLLDGVLDAISELAPPEKSEAPLPDRIAKLPQ